MSEIVVGYDGSDCSKAALERAIDLAKALRDSLVIVFGYAPSGLWGGELAPGEEEIEELGAKRMAEAKLRAVAAGVETDLEMVPRRAAEALIETADVRGARMIVVGSNSDLPVRGMILGSTPNKLLHLAKQPVLVVPADGG